MCPRWQKCNWCKKTSKSCFFDSLTEQNNSVVPVENKKILVLSLTPITETEATLKLLVIPVSIYPELL